VTTIASLPDVFAPKPESEAKHMDIDLQEEEKWEAGLAKIEEQAPLFGKRPYEVGRSRKGHRDMREIAWTNGLGSEYQAGTILQMAPNS